jgi:exoribonuclease-2
MNLIVEAPETSEESPMKSDELLIEIACKSMLERGFQPEFPAAVNKQLEAIVGPASYDLTTMCDLRSCLFCSIDNDDSLDLDQLTMALKLPNGGYRLLIAIADVDALVAKGTPIDLHAQVNTTSIYTPAKMFPMLPEKLSTNLTSLNEQCERAAMVFELTLDNDMATVDANIYRAVVQNKAKLAYSSVGAWLEGHQAIPEKIAQVAGLEEALKLQDQIAQAMKRKRQLHGALTLETIEMKAFFHEGKVSSLKPLAHNRAHELIENLMIAANTASARYAIAHRLPSLRRVVRVPERWDRIVVLAKEQGESLPAKPDSLALDSFLSTCRKKDPETFPDLSLAIIKLLGSGEYVVEIPGDASIGHFGLALRDYTHSTAPNRRYPDLITQRLLKAALQGKEASYDIAELQALTKRCTKCEDAAAKVERRLKKCAPAIFLEDRIGERFDAIITGATEKGTWVRLHAIPIEGKLVVEGNCSLDVGDRVSVKLIHVDVRQGFIDFACV